VHHAAAMASGEPFRVNIFVGGAPAMTLAAVMPLPEGLSELSFAGALAGHRIPLVRQANGLPIYGEADFCITGTVADLRRFGKALIVDFDNSSSLMIHLRMTGQLIYDPLRTADGPSKRFAAGHPSENFLAGLPNRQTRVILRFDAGTLFFNDQRKFGFIKIIETKEVPKDSFIKKLAKEPWVMTTDELYGKFQRHKNSLVKATILDQSIICGLGNIYADEALFAAKIHPERRSGTLSLKETELLLKSVCEVMDKSIDSGGSTMATYVKADGTKGDYLEKFAQVFRREGKSCPVCGTKIIKIKVAGRGTHVCPHCQKEPQK
jgi:formamidopyrimidine-DNA glycosylase